MCDGGSVYSGGSGGVMCGVSDSTCSKLRLVSHKSLLKW